MKNDNLKVLINSISILAITILALTLSISTGWAKSEYRQMSSVTPTVQLTSPTPNPTTSSVSAVTQPTPIPDVSSYNKSASFMLKDLGIDPIILYYPASASVPFNLPDYWDIAIDGNYVEFHYDYEAVVSTNVNNQLGKTNTLLSNTQYTEPPVEVRINDVYIDSFIPVVGKDQRARILLPAKTLASLTDSTNPTKQFIVSVGFYRSLDYYCGTNAILTIHDDSKLFFGFNLVAPSRDLSILPRSLIQGSFIPDTVVLVVPDKYNESDLTAISNLVSFISNSGLGTVRYKVLTASQATQAVLAPYSVISIGQPTRNSLTEKLYKNGFLPTKLSSNGLIIEGGNALPEEYGVIQLIPSPYNNFNTFLVVSGNSDNSSALAAQQLNKTTSGISSNVYVFQPSFSEEVANTSASVTSNNEYKVPFSQINYSTQVFRGPGTVVSNLSFYVPRNWDIQTGSKLLLNFNFSSRLSSYTSALVVSLNGVPVGSLPFDKSIQGDRVAEIELNPKDINRGLVNTIGFSAVLKPELDCTELDPSLYWITLRNNSILDIPYKLINDSKNLAAFTNPFTYLANESNLLVVMPTNPGNDDLIKMVNIIANISTAAQTGSPNIVVTRDAEIDTNQFKDYNVLVVGRPSQNTFLAKNNDILLQPFVPGQDSLKQQQANLEIHTPQDVNIGLIEVIPLPSNPFRGMTVVSGTTPTGMQYGVDTTDTLYLFDGGDLFYIGANDNVISYLSRVNIGTISEIMDSVVETPQQEVAVTAVPVGTSVSVKQPVVQNTPIDIGYGFLFAVIGVGLIVILLGGYQLYRNRIEKK